MKTSEKLEKMGVQGEIIKEIKLLESTVDDYMELQEKIGKFYEEDAEGDLCDIGEEVARHFGFTNSKTEHKLSYESRKNTNSKV